MIKYFGLILITALVMVSCGEKVDQLKEVAEAVKNAPEAAEQMQEASNRAEQRMQERKAKGDTLAMHFQELMKYLPTSLNGYKPEEPEGNTTNTMGFSMTQVSRSFVKETPNGNEYIRVELVDYNAGYAYMTGLTYWAALNISNESTEGFEKTFKTNIEDVVGFEKFTKSSKNANVTYAVGYRFWLNITGDNQSGTDLLKKIAEGMDLKKLASM